MTKIETEKQYKVVCERVEELLKVVLSQMIKTL